MTDLEARITALEQDIVIFYAAIRQIGVTQTLFTSVTTAQLQTLIDQVKRLREDGDEWKDFT